MAGSMAAHEVVNITSTEGLEKAVGQASELHSHKSTASFYAGTPIEVSQEVVSAFATLHAT